jgi:hypothetical protein
MRVYDARGVEMTPQEDEPSRGVAMQLKADEPEEQPAPDETGARHVYDARGVEMPPPYEGADEMTKPTAAVATHPPHQPLRPPEAAVNRHRSRSRSPFAPHSEDESVDSLPSEEHWNYHGFKGGYEMAPVEAVPAAPADYLKDGKAVIAEGKKGLGRGFAPGKWTKDKNGELWSWCGQCGPELQWQEANGGVWVRDLTCVEFTDKQGEPRTCCKGPKGIPFLALVKNATPLPHACSPPGFVHPFLDPPKSSTHHAVFIC